MERVKIETLIDVKNFLEKWNVKLKLVSHARMLNNDKLGFYIDTSKVDLGYFVVIVKTDIGIQQVALSYTAYKKARKEVVTMRSELDSLKDLAKTIDLGVREYEEQSGKKMVVIFDTLQGDFDPGIDIANNKKWQKHFSDYKNACYYLLGMVEGMVKANQGDQESNEEPDICQTNIYCRNVECKNNFGNECTKKEIELEVHHLFPTGKFLRCKTRRITMEDKITQIKKADSGFSEVIMDYGNIVHYKTSKEKFMEAYFKEGKLIAGREFEISRRILNT